MNGQPEPSTTNGNGSHTTNTPKQNEVSAAESYTTPHDPALRYAWRLYNDFDGISVQQKGENLRRRTWIIVLVWFTSVLALVPSSAIFAGWLSPSVPYIRAALVLLPAITAALLTFAGQFTPPRVWIAYRAGAEKIRREIYLYRLQAGDYTTESSIGERQQHLLSNVGDLAAEIMQPDAVPHFPSPAYNRKRYPEYFSEENAALTAPQRDDLPVPVNTDTKEDDGYSLLGGMEYMRWRVIPQRDWYKGKIYKDFDKLRQWRTGTLVVGVLGSGAAVAAYVLPGTEVLIAIVAATTLSIGTYVQLKMFGGLYGSYSRTLSLLNAEKAKWDIRPESDKADPDVTRELGDIIETIFQEERDVWIQHATQAQVESEQALARGVERQSARPGRDSGQSESTTATSRTGTGRLPRLTTQSSMPPRADTPPDDAGSQKNVGG